MIVKWLKEMLIDMFYLPVLVIAELNFVQASFIRMKNTNPQRQVTIITANFVDILNEWFGIELKTQMTFFYKTC